MRNMQVGGHLHTEKNNETIFHLKLKRMIYIYIYFYIILFGATLGSWTGPKIRAKHYSIVLE